MTRPALRPALTARALARPHLSGLAGGLACAGVVAACGALYAYLTGPLLVLLLSGGERGGATFGALLPSALPGADSAPSLAMIAALLVALAAIKGVAQMGQAVLLDGAAERIGHGLRLRLYGHLLRLPLAVHRRLAVGQQLARLLDDVRRAQEATVGVSVSIARDALGAVALMIVAFVISPGLALLAMITLPAVGVVIALLARRVRRAASHGQSAIGELSERAHQGLVAVREVKSCGAEARELQSVSAHSGEALRWARRRIASRAAAPLFNEVLAAAALGITIIYAGRLLGTGAAPERIVSFFTAVLLLYRPIKGVGNAVQTAAAGRASVERLAELLAFERERADATVELAPLRRAFQVRGLRYRYPDGVRALDGVDLELRVGRIVAVTGPSGAGKSTLADIVCGLLAPEAGQLLWDGRPLDALPLAALRAQVALVPQRPLMLALTLAENLRYGAPAARDEELADAMVRVGLGEWLASLPRGLDTVIGPAGRDMSVGQAQRVALARALLRPARLLVLDEPSSALDAESERRLREAVRAAGSERAILIIAHREPLLELAHEVVRLDAGRRIELPPAPGALAPLRVQRQGRLAPGV